MMKNYPIRNNHHLESALGLSIEEIDSLTNDLNSEGEKPKHYYRFVQRKMKNGKLKEREITPSRYTLSLIQDRIKDRILDQIPLPDYVKGGRKNNDSASNAAKHKGKNHNFLTDIKEFFPRITNKMVYDTFILLGFIPSVARCLTRLTTYKGHIPQGASTSTAVANIVFHYRVEKELEKIIAANGLTYTRWVDDLTFSSQREFKELVSSILDTLNAGGFMHSHKKTLYKKGRVDITGADKGNNTMRPTKAIIEKMANPNLSEAQIRSYKSYDAMVRAK